MAAEADASGDAAVTKDSDQRLLPPAHGVSAFRISVDSSRGLVSVAGELDREHAPQLAAALSTLAETSHEVWLIDTARVTFCDASGLRALAAAAAVADAHGCRLSMSASSRCVQRLVTLVGLSHLLIPPEPDRPQQVLPGPDSRPQLLPRDWVIEGLPDDRSPLKRPHRMTRK